MNAKEEHPDRSCAVTRAARNLGRLREALDIAVR
jgi:hypothetical protein